MANSFILATSGLILPDSSYYTELTPDKVTDNSIFNKSTFVTTDNTISDFIKSNLIHTSEIANEAYKKYLAKQDFNSYMQLIDITSDILGKINMKVFLEIQANNRNLSPIMFMMLVSIFTGKFEREYLHYASVPCSARFMPNGSVSNEVIAKRKDAIQQINYMFYNNWDIMLSSIADNRTAFSVMFNNFFVDNY